MSNAEKTDNPVVTIRPMVEEDLPLVGRMEQQLFSDPWSISAFAEALTEPSWGALVAEIDGLVVAYACYLIIDVEAHLTNIAVAEGYRRKSVAKHILDRILRIVTEAKCECLLLEVRPSNVEAVAFYRKHDFHQLYRRPNYYQNPVEDAQVMVYYLGNKHQRD
ncbi:MAG: ribosomal protein S18-alanine N-acetyltransferase [candidate division Zixibacteria bacterium]|nr:ribosomal protein S18-alanine N-acetyltransferase [candidate division Zixibacteria bacterium]MDH3938585.1 ribosomal protein S18-alanine N-acetyltransferase [candidate division Zixibacteria bacterium]MDH4033686.1 ribosomal protein S18-alanine N-acetyltransferase [candidate division Zixibacteria bacterium]